MTKNPLINALSASVYIVLIVSIMNYGSKVFDNSDPTLAPVVFISLFTLSAAVMGYLFCYQPIQLYFNQQQKQAAQLFIQTVLSFAFITFLFLILLFSGLIS